MPRSDDPKLGRSGPKASWASLLKVYWRLGKPFWFSSEAAVAWLLLIVVVALTLAGVYLLVLFNTWNQEFYDAVQKFDQNAFWQLILKFCYLAAIYILAGVMADYWTGILQNRWRLWMTRRYLNEWLNDKSHYLWQLAGSSTDNPDQRISEDVRDYVEKSLNLSLGLLEKGVKFVSFVGILWKLSGPLDFVLLGQNVDIPGYMAWGCLLYALCGTQISQWIGRPLIFLNYQRQHVEADFRFGLVRLRENGESVALSDGEAMEGNSLKSFYNAVYSNFNSLVRKRMHLGFFQVGYDQAAVVFPYLLAAPRYFLKQISLGGLFQVADAFGQVNDSLAWVVANYDDLANWRSVVERLEGFESEIARTKELRKAALSTLDESSGSKRIEIKDLSLSLPGGLGPLVKDLNVSFVPKGSVLISGASGAGKSTFLRAVGGLWPFAEGKVRLPKGQQVMILPQKPYLPLGTLRAAIAYPSAPEAFDDLTLRKVLKLCRLESFESRLEERQAWAQTLSLGEQQRVAWARVFLHKPQWLFLDEATSALDEATQDLIYKNLKKALPKTSLISVAHTQVPARRHRKVWKFDRI